MMSFYTVFSLAAGIITLLAFGLYIVSILRHQSQPNKASWTIWTLVGTILAMAYSKTGDINTIWLPISLCIGPAIIMLLSFKFGYAQWSMLDKICLTLACLALIPWLFYDSPQFTLIFTVAIDSLGAIPTLRGCYNHPETEEIKVWALLFLGSLVEMFAIQQWSIALLYPIYLVTANCAILVTLIIRRSNHA